MSGLGTNEICSLAVVVFVFYATWIKDGSEFHLHWANTATWNSIHCNSFSWNFIKKLQGKCMDMGFYCLCSRTKFTPFIGFEGAGNELLLWPCHSPEDRSFKLKADLILSHWIAFQQGCQGNFIFVIFSVQILHTNVKNIKLYRKGQDEK